LRTSIHSKFWQELFKILHIKINLSSAFHPETNGQTERVNQLLEQYLRCTINYHQDDWVELLPLAEFTYNNTKHASTHHTPFFANCGQHPKFDTFHIENDISNPSVEDFATQLQILHEEITSYLEESQQIYKINADEQQKEPPSFKVGDKVWLL
jgi:hypothetical protein